MSFHEVTVEKLDSIARITINRPDQLNAISRKTLQEMERALKELRRDSTIRVIVLTGAGEKAFCAGADLKGGMFTPEQTQLKGPDWREWARNSLS
jgi:enoyl-CoA hydratase/carnithine racemase